jgi:hypothetical protein
MRLLLPFPLLLLLASPASARTTQAAAPASACTAPASPTGELSTWTQPGPLTAAATMAQIDEAGLEIGKAATVTLLRAGKVAYPVRAGSPWARRAARASGRAGDRAGTRRGYGGLIHFDIAQPGTYRIALASAGRIDVEKDGRAYPSTAHGRGAECTGIRKIVNFELTPGRYTLQISDNAAAHTKVMLARMP